MKPYFSLAWVLGLASVVGLVSTPVSFWQQTFGEDHAITQTFSELKVTLDLDLAGGTELDYKIDLADATAQNNDDDETNNIEIPRLVSSVRDAIEYRVNPAGIGEIRVVNSKINGEEHILVQLPPSSNVSAVKASAEQDNRLRFYAENPARESNARTIASEVITGVPTQGWKKLSAEKIAASDFVELLEFDTKFYDQITDKNLAEKLEKNLVVWFGQ